MEQQRDTDVHMFEKEVGPDLQAQAAAHDYEYHEESGKEAVKSGARGAAGEATDMAKRAQHGAVDALREGGASMESAAGAAKDRATAAKEAIGEKAEEVKGTAAQKADELASRLRKEEEAGMTASERASGRARAEASNLQESVQEAGGAVSEKVHGAQVGAVQAMRETGANIAEGLDSVASKATEAVEGVKEKLGFGGK